MISLTLALLAQATSSTAAAPAAGGPSLSALLASAEQHNFDRRISREQQARAAAELKQAWSTLFPGLSVSAGWTHNQYASEIPAGTFGPNAITLSVNPDAVCPTGTSMSLASTMRTCTPVRGRPHEPGGRSGSSSVQSGQEISDMLKPARYEKPNRFAKPLMKSEVGMMLQARSGLSASSGRGGALSRNAAMTPIRPEASVALLARIWSQKREALNPSWSASDAPRTRMQ